MWSNCEFGQYCEQICFWSYMVRFGHMHMWSILIILYDPFLVKIHISLASVFETNGLWYKKGSLAFPARYVLGRAENKARLGLKQFTLSVHAEVLRVPSARSTCLSHKS